MFQHELKNDYIGEVWTPGANTVAYYPLTANANDESWNWRNITTSWASSYSSNWALLPNSNHAWLLIPFSIDTSNDYTFSLWQQPLYMPSHDDMRWIDLTESSTNRLISLWRTWWEVWHWWGSNFEQFWDTFNYSINTRYYMTYTIKSWVINVYKNWELIWTKSWVSWHTCALRFWQEWNMWADRHWYWYMKDIIIENKARTAQEIAEYYNQTKSNYWL